MNVATPRHNAPQVLAGRCGAESLMSSFAECSVLVTGGTGFIGYHLVQRLCREGARVAVLVRDSDNLGRLEPLRAQLNLIEGDLSAPSFADLRFTPQFVFHLAAANVDRPLDDWAGAINANITGTANLLQWCSEDENRAELQSVVYTGTPFEYGPRDEPRGEDDALRPPNFYAASKAAGWLFCQAFAELRDLPIVGARPFLTYGPHQGTQRLIPAVVIAALQKREIPLTGGRQLRDFIYIDDVVDGLLRVAQTPTARGEMFNLGSGTGVTLREVVQRVFDLSGSSALCDFGALPYRKGELWDLRADVKKARDVLGWQAQTSLDAGLQQTIDWYRAHLSTFS
ncbi:MAG: NAD-dependent epimerase/dehydratase family protein [Acidimicrobiales bacterium]